MLGPPKTAAQIFADLVRPASRRWQEDPVAWADEICGVVLWSKQREILESVRDHKRTAVRSCHEVGKSFSAAVAVAWWLSVHEAGSAFAVTTAPTFNQVRSILWREIGALHSRSGLPGRTNQTEWKINDQLVAIGRKPSDYNQHGMQGLHAENMLVVIDEACGVSKTMYDAVSTLVAGEGGRILAIGNPDTADGEFFQCFRVGSGWNQIHISSDMSPNFTEEAKELPPRVLKALVHPSWQEDRAQKWGVESALYQSKVLGEFPKTGDPWTVIPLSWVDQCRYLEFIPGKKPVEGGIDVGAGGDRTVVAIREGNRLKSITSFVDSDPMRTVALIARELRDSAVMRAKIDTIGIGWGIYGRLRELSSKHFPQGECIHDAEIIPINVAESSDEPERFQNLRAQLWWEGRERSRLATWDFSGLAGYRDVLDDVIAELTMPKYQIVDSKGRIKIEPKEDIRKRLHASPDLAEAVLLAFHETSHEASTLGASALMNQPSLLSWGDRGANAYI